MPMSCYIILNNNIKYLSMYLFRGTNFFIVFKTILSFIKIYKLIKHQTPSQITLEFVFYIIKCIFDSIL